MINYDSILSVFDGKPTLLQWLKLVKKALDESVLKNITLKQDGANVVFTFNFEDGTSISTPAVTLPKGDTGAKGDKGEQGVSVTGVDEVSNEVVGGQTLTTLRFNFSNGTNDEVVVHAENGKDASSGKLYRHNMGFYFWDSGDTPRYRIAFDVYSTSSEKAETISKFKELYDGGQTPTCLIIAGETVSGVGFLRNLFNDSSKPELLGYLGSWTPVDTLFPNLEIIDYVIEV